MTPFELQLLQTAWPYVWMLISVALPAGAGYFLRQQASRLTALTTAVQNLSEEIAKIDKQMALDRAAIRERMFKMAGQMGQRIAVLETQNDIQHPDGPRRRATDPKQELRWDVDSDVGSGIGVSRAI